MKNQENRKRQLHKKKCRAVLGFITSLVLLCLAGGVLVAKYYAGRSNKGVATASSLYFSSNVLKSLNNGTGDPVEGNYPIIYNTSTWNGNDPYIFDVEIRNYQNQLLYNDRNLDITYDISFELMDTTDGGSYSVSYGNETRTLTSENKTAVFSNKTLQGGMARADQFKISVTRPDSQKDNPNYRSCGILVIAKPVSPSYVKDSIKLGGILYATMVSAQYKLEHNFNKVTAGNSPLSDFCGFPCTITYMPGEDNAAHEVKVKWKNNLEIDQHNAYYLQAKQESGRSGMETSDETTWNYMIITMQPYSSIQIAFYRADSFDDETVKLLECIQLVDLTKAEGSGTNQ
ncbi:MAG: hypothetical protein PUC12_01500 [Clostridiales bacterium]|nr:hypothetical protein [Clostridiales bacterium]